MLVKTKIENHILSIALNRADKKNAFNPQMIEQITAAFKLVEADDDIRGVLLTGEGDCFCAGADLEWMKSMINYSLEENITDSEKLHHMFYQGLTCEVPVVGVFQGYVMGGAVGLAAICDVGISLKETRYAFSEVKIGLAPAVISPFIFNKMNYNKAGEFMLTGKMFSSQEALNSGLIEYIADPSNQKEVIDKVLKRIRTSAPKATRETKKLLRKVKALAVDESRELTSKLISERRMSSEGQEGLSSFFDKRKPNWIGEL